MNRLLIAFLLLLLSLCDGRAAGTKEVFATNIDVGGTDLRWVRYVPISGGPRWPAAIIIHGGQHKAMSPGPTNVAQDLAAAGFLTFAIEYRLAPPHTEMNNPGPPGDGQADPPSDGRPPEQTDDAQRAIRAARADSQCNGKVVVLGFSAGGLLGGWWAVLGTNNDDRPDAFVGCSGDYDVDDSNLLGSSYRGSIENYLNHTTDEGTTFHTAAKAASVYWQAVTSTPCPVLLFNSTSETIPQSIFNNTVTKLINAGGTLESHLRTGNEHGSSYWNLGYGGSFPTVKDCSIDFLNRMVLGGSPTPPPVAPAKIVLLRK